MLLGATAGGTAAVNRAVSWGSSVELLEAFFEQWNIEEWSTIPSEI